MYPNQYISNDKKQQTKKLMSDPNGFIILSPTELLSDIYFNSSAAI